MQVWGIGHDFRIGAPAGFSAAEQDALILCCCSVSHREARPPDPGRIDRATTLLPPRE